MRLTQFLQNLLTKKFDPATSSLYNACVAAARQPVFYTRFGVPDDTDGRFDLLLLHVTLVMLQIKDRAANQRLFDLMFADMERSLREMGVGDMSIGKKMKPMLAGFYGRGTAYREALANDNDAALTFALSRNLYGLASGTAPHAPELAQYVRNCTASLAAQNPSDLSAGRPSFALVPQS